MEILQNNGYAAEAHNVVTKDGYILEVHRIAKSKSGQKPTRNHPVLVQHGILGSSADWVLGGAEKSLRECDTIEVNRSLIIIIRLFDSCNSYATCRWRLRRVVVKQPW